jgi:SAM-dependent methyltransferase
MQSWQDFFELSKSKAPSPLLETAIQHAPSRDQALDLGAGALRDSKFLLSMGFRQVTAQDQDERIKAYAAKIPRSVLKFRVTPFEKIRRLPSSHYDLVNASFSLPFTHPPLLPPLFEKIKKSLKPEGIFCGQFFGPEDTWNKTNKRFITFTSRSEVKTMLDGLNILYFKERKFSGTTIDGKQKFWHIFDVIAQKI